MKTRDGNIVTTEYFKDYKAPEWLDTDTIAVINSDSKLINQYRDD